MESVYLETSFVSYLAAMPSRDLVVAAHQRISEEWWTMQRGRFKCFVSQLVVDEISQGDMGEVRKRLDIVKNLGVLDATEDAEELAARIAASGIVPSKAANDATHIAIAAVHGMDYILTWNCRHLANAQILKKVRAICAAAGWQAPDVCTPEELMGGGENG